MDLIIFSIWFFLPAGASNGIAVIASRIPGLGQFSAPIDGKRTWRGKRLMGDHKTWRGLIVGTIAATLLAMILQAILNSSSWLQSVDGMDVLAGTSAPLLGALLGFGALSGDAIESLFKRQLGIKPGGKWFPFDQIDYIIGGLLLAAPVVILDLPQYLTIFAVWFGMHLFFSYLGFLGGLKDSVI